MEMKKVVINKGPGILMLSAKAFEFLGIPSGTIVTSRLADRENPDLIRVIEALGAEANGYHSIPKIVEIPADVEYTIEYDEEDGSEYICEVHRTWN